MTDDANIDRITKRMESLMDDIKELANIAYTYTAEFSVLISLWKPRQRNLINLLLRMNLCYRYLDKPVSFLHLIKFFTYTDYFTTTEVPLVNVSNAGENLFPISRISSICSFEAVVLFMFIFTLNC